MSIYVMSDLHGELEKYEQMLGLISFSDEDSLFVLGDVLDRGHQPVELLRRMSLRPNIFPLLGNHELMALDALQVLLVEITEENYSSVINVDIIERILEWQQDGGGVTMEQFARLPKDDRQFLYEYLGEFAPFEEIEVGGHTFVLTHSGCVSADQPLSEHSIVQLTFMRPDYDRQVFDDNSIYLVCGHTPTQTITGKSEIYHNNNYINIDCGAVFGGRLACLRLDDLAEFYV